MFNDQLGWYAANGSSPPLHALAICGHHQTNFQTYATVRLRPAAHYYTGNPVNAEGVGAESAHITYNFATIGHNELRPQSIRRQTQIARNA